MLDGEIAKSVFVTCDDDISIGSGGREILHSILKIDTLIDDDVCVKKNLHLYFSFKISVTSSL